MAQENKKYVLSVLQRILTLKADFSPTFQINYLLKEAYAPTTHR